MEYEVSIRIDLPEDVGEILRKEKERFVAEYGSGYKSQPHITLYLDRYEKDGFSKLARDLGEFGFKPFTITLLPPQVRREEHRSRNLYVLDISGKEQVQELHDAIERLAIPYRSPLLREKTRKRLEQRGISTDGTRESLKVHNLPEEPFDPHITLGEVGFGNPQPDLTEVQTNLKQLEGREITVSDVTAYFYGKEEGDEKAKLVEKVTIPFQSEHLGEPEFVYHGSPNGEIKEFIPRVSPGSGEQYGPQIYASRNPVTAVIFMADVGKSWSADEMNGVLYAVIPLSREEFLKRDKGGFLYKLPASTFSLSPKRGMGDEWASSVPVKPVAVEKLDSVLDAMIENGVQVYFVTDEQYEAMRSSGKPRWQALRGIRSENEERGVNMKTIG